MLQEREKKSTKSNRLNALAMQCGLDCALM